MRIWLKCWTLVLIAHYTKTHRGRPNCDAFSNSLFDLGWVYYCLAHCCCSLLFYSVSHPLLPGWASGSSEFIPAMKYNRALRSSYFCLNEQYWHFSRYTIRNKLLARDEKNTIFKKTQQRKKMNMEEISWSVLAVYGMAAADSFVTIRKLREGR